MKKILILAALCTAATMTLARDLREAWWTPVAPDGVQRARIRCGPNFIDPRVIVVRAGIPAELLISGAPALASHSFTLANPRNVQQGAADAVAAEPKAVRFTPDEPGEYPIACRDDSGTATPAQQKSKQGVFVVLP